MIAGDMRSRDYRIEDAQIRMHYGSECGFRPCVASAQSKQGSGKAKFKPAKNGARFRRFEKLHLLGFL